MTVYWCRNIAEIQANYVTIINTLLAGNIAPIIVLGPPIDNSEGSQRSVQQIRQMSAAANVWKRAYCGMNSNSDSELGHADH